ncbi:PH domain-containing protein [Paenibacillus mucilaginosus]|uniref:Uncharacterized protein YyaB-like PH domain-containing protein n=2 Tax=Paenibacillus mucilaginosus TaxID=61624 RepID=I0BES9_9BACL|nr:PH domain-containing protein [Paenibacillus mucilaginosus]AEI40043.1 hypothetical protein KNP414_01479 [Paenibacillus mucilaginosus KNP414]AFH60876.1 hypothetical protein B2K_09110 [Paenibacillus mucilaginosus K02]MCG7215653.1 PH domain-containing protein [Paenibacillus mucilaginosus]WDM29286.1 PH domain-containing protein [Paenibacillus mucilaginosus]
MTRFRSDKDKRFAAVHWTVILVLLAIFGMCFRTGWWPAGMLPLGAAAFFLWAWYGTWYELRGAELLIRSGPVKRRIPVAAIRLVRRTNQALSAPALSLRRLEIVHEQGSILISPAEPVRFIDGLLGLNPRIKADYGT